MEKIIFQVKGMVCGEFEIAINRAVRKLAGIKKVKSSRWKKQTVVEYDPAEILPTQIREAIAQTGYDIQ